MRLKSNGIARGRRRRTTAAIAGLSAAALVLSACGSDDDDADSASSGDDDTAAAAVCGPDAVEAPEEITPATLPEVEERETSLKIGTILPQSGSLAFLGPPEFAGVDLAIHDINAAGGVLGGNVESFHKDSGDGENDIASAAAEELATVDEVQVVIGAASSGVTRFFIDYLTKDQGIVQISPANTAIDLSEWDDDGYYFRTAPSDVLQGTILGNLMISDGHERIGVIYLNDPYGIGLSTQLTTTVEEQGGEVVASELYNDGDTNLTAQIDAVTAEDPDAIALITFDPTKTIVPELVGTKGFPSDALYLVDGNLSDYSEDFDEGLLNCAKGTLPGTFAESDFKSRLLAIDPDLTDYSYAAESYDAVMIAALAAVAGGDTSSETIRDNLIDVTRDGTKVTDFAEAVALLEEGEDIDYDGVSGPITLDDQGNPTEAFIGVYQYGSDNTYAPLSAEYGQLE